MARELEITGPYPIGDGTFAATVSCGRSMAMRRGFLTSTSCQDWINEMIPKVKSKIAEFHENEMWRSLK